MEKKSGQLKRKKTLGKRKKNSNRGSWLLLLLIVPVAAGIIFSLMPKPSVTRSNGPQFQKEGTLSFIGKDSAIALASIDIEVASDDLSRAQGLMWRRSMREDQGMLFIMDQEEIQSFWMLNTYISLDIIFVDAEKRIVTIRPDTTPQSLDAVASQMPALYVIEVNAGFCKKYGITAGDKIEFELFSGTF